MSEAKYIKWLCDKASMHRSFIESYDDKGAVKYYLPVELLIKAMWTVEGKKHTQEKVRLEKLLKKKFREEQKQKK